jgi:hypothetical protein
MQIHSLMQPGAFGPEAIAAMGDAASLMVAPTLRVDQNVSSRRTTRPIDAHRQGV